MITKRDWRLRTVFETAAIEARLRHDPLVGTEHLLLARDDAEGGRDGLWHGGCRPRCDGRTDDL